MMRSLKMRYYQFQEKWQSTGLLSAVKFSIYRCEEAVPVEKELSTLKTVQAPPDTGSLRLVEFNGANLPGSIVYPLRSRREKAHLNLRKGYRTLALIRDGEVVADVWYVTRETPDHGIERYLQWFGIELAPDEAYLFDMYVCADARGKAMATYFLGSVLQRMSENGFTKAYGYFDANNFPALWVHRLLGYKERPRLRVRKVLIYEKAVALS